MPKKKPAPKAKDQHKSGFMIRLPEEARTLLSRIKDKMGQAYTVATLRAIREYAKTHGIDPPGAKSE